MLLHEAVQTGFHWCFPLSFPLVFSTFAHHFVICTIFSRDSENSRKWSYPLKSSMYSRNFPRNPPSKHLGLPPIHGNPHRFSHLPGPAAAARRSALPSPPPAGARRRTRAASAAARPRTSCSATRRRLRARPWRPATNWGMARKTLGFWGMGWDMDMWNIVKWYEMMEYMDQIEYLRNLKVWVFLFRLKYKSAISGVSMGKSSNSMDLNGAALHVASYWGLPCGSELDFWNDIMCLEDFLWVSVYPPWAKLWSMRDLVPTLVGPAALNSSRGIQRVRPRLPETSQTSPLSRSYSIGQFSKCQYHVGHQHH